MASPDDDRDIRSACAAWLGSAEIAVTALAAGGFSGVPVFEVRAAAGRFVLKAFAVGTPPDRAAWVHRLMRHLRSAGDVAIPEPVATPDGRTLVADPSGRLWELVGFVAGSATTDPTAAQATAALVALARVHRAAASLPGQPPTLTAAPALLRRIDRVRGLLADPWHARMQRLPGRADATGFPGAVRQRLAAAIAAFAEARGALSLNRFASLPAEAMPVQAALRDVWSEHVLFATDRPDRVAGFIDLHAAGIDSPAADIARLLGSWQPSPSGGGDLLDRWPAAIAAYETVRPLAAAERRAIPLLHAAGVVVGLDNWFRWVLEEGRVFGRSQAAIARIDRLLAALPEALHQLATIGPVSEIRPV